MLIVLGKYLRRRYPSANTSSSYQSNVQGLPTDCCITYQVVKLHTRTSILVCSTHISLFEPTFLTPSTCMRNLEEPFWILCPSRWKSLWSKTTFQSDTLLLFIIWVYVNMFKWDLPHVVYEQGTISEDWHICISAFPYSTPNCKPISAIR